MQPHNVPTDFVKIGKFKVEKEYRYEKRWLSRCSDSLGAGWFGDKIPAGKEGARFSTPIQTCLGAHKAFCKKGTEALYRWPIGPGRVSLTTHI